MKRFVQVVLYLQMVYLTFAAVLGFLAHQFPIARQEQALARQVGFVLLGFVVTLWIVSRFWQREPRLLLIPIAFTIAGLIYHASDAVIVGANLGLPAPSGSDIYVPLVSDAIVLGLYLVGYLGVRRSAQDRAASAAGGTVASAAGPSR